MGSFILAAVVFFVFAAVAFFAEFARGMSTAPSNYPSHFVNILAVGVVLSVLIALSHWLPHPGW